MLPKRWSIRNQILLPLITIQVVAVLAITLVTATLAAQRVERQIIDRLNGVVHALAHPSFPYTSSVLAQMRDLSGAHFIDYDQNGAVAASTLPKLGEPTPILRSVRPTARVASLGGAPTVVLGAERYFAVPVRSSKRGSTLLVLYPESSWRQARREAALPPLALGFGTLGLMASVTGWIAHRISRRIGRVQQQVARVAGGDFRVVDEGGGRDEIRDLARSFNQMCDQLREMQRAVRQSERTRILAQLAAGLAHQLRNSLTGARMSVQLHAKRYPPPEGDLSLEVALRQLAMTEEQVRGLLSLGRVEPRVPAPCDLSELLADVALLVGPSCQHAKVALRAPLGVGALNVLADASSLRAAILNLTLNAIEAAGSGGEVRLDRRADGDQAIVEVSDTGPGPAPDLADRLTEAFVTSKPEGVGLGLAIAHQVAVEHGGRLSWTREEGATRFRLALPRGIATPGTPA